jgi:GIY-YIG catalytic domain
MTSAPRDPGLAATLHHIGILDARRKRLIQAQTEAEEQLFHRIGVMRARGDLTLAELQEIHAACRELQTVGMSLRWNAHIDISWSAVRHCARFLPNGPEGTWVGVVPLETDDHVPRFGTAVVYVLFGDDNEPCYVGSTADLRTRVNQHFSDGKQFARWQAYPCETREAAYLLEERLLAERLPRLNRRRGR